ncbi:class I SAM-dependent methyltransferase [Fodinicola acaciae]|uniref:class I SAM-dependent methyltransferase n=1 Tax=Fodinicola acaciae TaxID=2681555 RepID=UPI0013CFFE31|nr:class I SAM-dependent methyltransferase [Fodinicola acaciae]
MEDYVRFNQASWDERAPVHATSRDYHVEAYKTDPKLLSQVVTFDLPRLGSVEGLRGVHLQCHIGTDTVSLSRLGAKMTGLDFSAASLAEARALVRDSGDDVDFVQGNVYDAVELLGEGQFDLVFTGIGALCWIPDIRRWAGVVAALLRPGGRLFIREGHPMLWSLDDPREDGLLAVEFPYFERKEATVWTEGGTYVETDHVFANNTTHEWNHGLGEIVTALLANGLRLTMLEEHESAPWDPLPGMSERLPDGEFRLADRPWRLPQTYTLQAVKPG